MSFKHRQLHAHHGLPLPLEIRHDEFTADIPENQLLAYCTILGLPAGHLVYARGNASPARHVIRQSGIEILCHAIDLSQPPDQLIGQMSNLAELVAAMAA